MNHIPAGFEPMSELSPFLSMLAPIYNKQTASGLVFGLRVEHKHCNVRGFVHGAVLTSLADMSLGYNLARFEDAIETVGTISLTVDFASSACLGEWIESFTDVQKVGRSVGFANCYFHVGDRRIARASGIFNIIRPQPGRPE